MAERRPTAWKNDPRKIPEFLNKLKIVKVEYHGLWAELTWTEGGTTPDRKRFQGLRR